jgi:peptidoglycan/xylan/chitin deacetylase (PgdA/CDA1 family)
MKKLWLIFIISLVLSACGSAEPTTDPNLIYTQAAQTVQAQLTGAAALIPPTQTLTVTPSPQPTVTTTNTPPATVTPTQAWADVPAGKVTAPVLLYNVIADGVDDDPYFQWESPLNIGSRQFEQQIMALKEMGYTSITIGQLTNVIWSGGKMPPKPVVITFDSNKLGVYKKAFPILKKYGFVGSIFIVVNQLNGDGVLSTNQLKELIAAGWDVGSKGMSGKSLVVVLDNNPETLGDEISGSRLQLEKSLGVPITTFSYPAGELDNGGAIVRRVQNWGYKSAVGLFKSSDHSMNTIYYLARYEIRKELSLDDFVSILPWKGSQPLSPETINFGNVQPTAAAPGAPAGSATTQP